jgi:DDE superfamily endonuclease
VNGDEKPWDSNQCRKTSLSTRTVRANVQTGARSSFWTVMCWIRANGEALPPLVIVDGQSVAIDVALANALEKTNASVTATERGFMDDVSFLAELRRVCPLIGNGEQPAIMLLDGHGSRLQREAARIFATHHIYCVLEPSNSSQYSRPDLDQRRTVAQQRGSGGGSRRCRAATGGQGSGDRS